MSCLKYYRPTVQLKRISNKFIIKEEKIMAMFSPVPIPMTLTY